MFFTNLVLFPFKMLFIQLSLSILSAEFYKTSRLKKEAPFFFLFFLQLGTFPALDKSTEILSDQTHTLGVIMSKTRAESDHKKSVRVQVYRNRARALAAAAPFGVAALSHC